MSFGKTLKELRKSRGLTQRELAEKTGLAEITIRNYEASKYRPKIEQLEKLSEALEVPVKTILEKEMSNTHYYYQSHKKVETDGKAYTEYTLVPYNGFDKKIESIRKERGLSQEDLATALKQPLKMIEDYENGHLMPTLYAFQEIAGILEVPLSTFIGERTSLHFQSTDPDGKNIIHKLTSDEMFEFLYQVNRVLLQEVYEANKDMSEEDISILTIFAQSAILYRKFKEGSENAET